MVIYGIPYMAGRSLGSCRRRSSSFPSTRALTWPRSCAAASSPSTAADRAARSIGMTHWQTMVSTSIAAGGAQHHALHRQRVRGQHQGFFGSERHLRNGAVLPGKAAAGITATSKPISCAIIYLILTFYSDAHSASIEKEDGQAGQLRDLRFAVRQPCGHPRGHRKRSSMESVSTSGICASPSARTKCSMTSTFPARARWPASSAPPVRARARFCAASTCWRHRTPARYSFHGKNVLSGDVSLGNYHARVGRCFSSSTSLTT